MPTTSVATNENSHTTASARFMRHSVRTRPGWTSDDAATKIRSTIESAINGLKGQSMARTASSAPSGESAQGFFSRRADRRALRWELGGRSARRAR